MAGEPTVKVTSKAPLVADPEFPARIYLGVVDDYVGGRPDQLQTFAHALQSLAASLLVDAAEIRAATSVGGDAWSGLHQQRFEAAVARLPQLISDQIVPALEDVSNRIRRFAGVVHESRNRTSGTLARGQAFEDSRYRAKKTKDLKRSAGNPNTGAEQAELTTSNRRVQESMDQLEGLRSQKRHEDEVVTRTLAVTVDDMSVAAHSAAVAAASLAVGTTKGQIGAAAVVSGSRQGGPGSAPADDGPIAGSSEVNGGAGGVINTRPDGGFAVGVSELIDPGAPSGITGSKLGASAALIASGVAAGFAPGSRAGAVPESASSSTSAAAVAGIGTSVSGSPSAQESVTVASVEDALLAASTSGERGDVGLAVLTVAAGAAAGLLIVALGAKAPGKLGLDAGLRQIRERLTRANALPANLDEVVTLSDDLPLPDGSTAFELPGGFEVDLPSGWAGAADANCAVLTPGPHGSFGPNIVAVWDSQALTLDRSLPAESLLLERTTILASQVEDGERFAYSTQNSGLTAHRLAVSSPSGGFLFVVATAATENFGTDAPVLDAVLGTIRPVYR